MLYKSILLLGKGREEEEEEERRSRNIVSRRMEPAQKFEWTHEAVSKIIVAIDSL